MRRLLLALAVVAALAACGSDQDPGVPAVPASGGTVTTSRGLPRCPAGGPDATTPPAGCLDEDGTVLHP